MKGKIGSFTALPPMLLKFKQADEIKRKFR
jgi:hypothetical protein